MSKNLPLKKTVVEIDPALHERLKKHVRRQGQWLKFWVARAVEQRLLDETNPQKQP